MTLMTDERNLGAEEQWFAEKLARKCLKSLERNNIQGFYAANRDEARIKIAEMIPPDASIGVGDSVTLLQVGIVQELEGRGTHNIANPFRKNGLTYIPPTRREAAEIGKRAMVADFFLTGINALTLDGKLVNTDGLGNRVGPLVFGPRKVIVVTGFNKIVEDVDAAIKRIRNVAAPINARRHHLKHGMETPPCGITGFCNDCKPPLRGCSFTVIVEGQRTQRITVALVGENLGI